MGAVHVRNVPGSLMTALRERAKRHGRSMQQEILEILETAAKEPVTAEKPEPIQLVTVKTSGTTTWRRAEIYGDEGR